MQVNDALEMDGIQGVSAILPALLHKKNPPYEVGFF